MTTIDPKHDPWLKDKKFGKIREVYINHGKEEEAEEMPMPDAPPQNQQPLHLDPDEPLLVEDKFSHSSALKECANSHDRPGRSVSYTNDGELDYEADAEWPFLNRLGHFCKLARIRRCERPKCLGAKKVVQVAIPSCKWAPFRDWALTLISCQTSASAKELEHRAYYQLAEAVNTCHWLTYQYKDGRRTMSEMLHTKNNTEVPVDVFGVCEIIYWMQIVQLHLIGSAAPVEGRLGPEFLQLSITAPVVEKAVREAREANLCQHRLWNLSIVCERKYVDLPALVEVAAANPQFSHPGHEECTVDICYSNFLDSTTVKQLHKAHDGADCEPPVEFKPELLSDSLKEKGLAKGRTDWTIVPPFVVPKDEKTKYMAVSHVWADGTGIGLGDAGKVNSCLFKYMADIATELKCDAIWWDTISIPTAKEVRRLAINRMHNNYENAECTVVHDQYLLDFEWADDGSPCVALVLSPWFTRGWTALELLMSGTVKVLFKGPTPLKPDIKDLDDILADDPSRCSRAHWIASTIIRRLRRKVNNTTDLMAVLKPRSTSKPGDRIIIAALLAHLELESSELPKEKRTEKLTKKVIDRLYRINPSSLHHGQVTMTELGGWSWCPPSLYDLPVDTAADLFQEGVVGDATYLVDKHGVVAGYWQYRALEERDIKEGRIVANSTQEPVILKIKTALLDWRHCMILREGLQDSGPGKAILIMPVNEEENFLHCRFIGSVLDFSPTPPSGYDKRYKGYWFKIGSKRKPDLEAKFYVTSDEPINDPSRIYDWLPGKLWIGDNPFKGHIIVARFERRGKNAVRGYYLKATADVPISQESTDKTDTDRAMTVFMCTAKAELSEKHVFRAEDTYYSSGKDLSRVIAENLWPPSTIPAKERTIHRWENDSGDDDKYSEDLFRLEGKNSGAEVFAALDPELYTPDPGHPYRGIWICMESLHTL